MGIVPVWGFQLIIAIALAFLFRLNKVLVILAANISVPPMIPIILFLSHATGAIWMEDSAQHISFSGELTLDKVKTSFTQYIVGAMTLAFVAGIFSSAMTYLALKVFKRQKT